MAGMMSYEPDFKLSECLKIKLKELGYTLNVYYYSYDSEWDIIEWS